RPYVVLSSWKNNCRIELQLTNYESIFEINYACILDLGAGSIHTLFSLPLGYPGGAAYGLMYIPPSLQSLFASGDTRGDHGTFMVTPYTDQMGRTFDWKVPPGPAFDKYLDETDAENMNTREWVRPA